MKKPESDFKEWSRAALVGYILAMEQTWKATAGIKLQADPPRLMDYYDIHPRPDIWGSAYARFCQQYWHLQRVGPDLERRDVPPASADMIEWRPPSDKAAVTAADCQKWAKLVLSDPMDAAWTESSRDWLIRALTWFGARRVSELQPEHYRKFVNRCRFRLGCPLI